MTEVDDFDTDTEVGGVDGRVGGPQSKLTR